MNVDITEKPQRIISFCTGIRGLERGLERAGVNMQPLAYVEIEAFIVANLVAQMEAGLLAPTPIWTNIKTFDPRPFRGMVDGFMGGYPCTPFSNAGKRKGEEDPRHLWPFIREAIRAVEPFWCFFENVAGHLTLGYETVRNELQGLGYIVKEGIFSSEEVGAPHQRKRLFILAIMGDPRQFSERSESYGFDRWAQGNQKRLGTDSWNRSSNTSEILVDTQYHGLPKPQIGGSLGKTSKGPKERAYEAGESKGASGQEINRNISGISLADTCGTGQQGSEWSRTFCEQRKTPCGSVTECREDKRPARPGQQQYEWESPRTISKEVEPNLGLSINEYNYREDLLRAIGNSVDEWVAEKAFITLLNKHLTPAPIAVI